MTDASGLDVVFVICPTALSGERSGRTFEQTVGPAQAGAFVLTGVARLAERPGGSEGSERLNPKVAVHRARLCRLPP